MVNFLIHGLVLRPWIFYLIISCHASPVEWFSVSSLCCGNKLPTLKTTSGSHLSSSVLTKIDNCRSKSHGVGLGEWQAHRSCTADWVEFVKTENGINYARTLAAATYLHNSFAAENWNEEQPKEVQAFGAIRLMKLLGQRKLIVLRMLKWSVEVIAGVMGFCLWEFCRWTETSKLVDKSGEKARLLNSTGCIEWSSSYKWMVAWHPVYVLVL